MAIDFETAEDVSYDDLVKEGFLTEDGEVGEAITGQPRDEKGRFTSSDTQDVKEGETEEANSGAKEPDEGSKKEPEEEDRRPVATKNGEGVIPYDVLASTRAKAKGLEAALEEQRQLNSTLMEQFQSLQAQVAAGQITQKQAQEEMAQTVLDNQEDGQSIDPAYYEEEFGPEIGALAKMLNRQIEMNNQLVEELQGVKKFTQTELADRQKFVVDNIESEIDNNPDLALWRETDPERWDMAVKIDETLRQSPAYVDVPLGERFKAVVSAVRSIKGDAPTVNDAVARAEKAASVGRGINTLSDVGSGTGIENTKERIDSMSVADLSAKFANMSEAEMEKWIRDNA